MNVPRVRVGDVLNLERIPIEVDLTETYVPIGIRSFGRGIFHYDPTDGSNLGKLRFFKVEPDRLVLSNIKGWEGALGVSTEQDAGCIASNRFLSYVADSERASVGYLKYFFLSDAGLPLIQRASPGSADRNRTLAIDRFESLTIPLPAIEEQRRIARELDAVGHNAARLTASVAKAAMLSNALPASLAQRHDLSPAEKRREGWLELPLGEVMHEVSEMVTVDPTQAYPNVGVLNFGRGLFEKPPIDGSTTSAVKLNRVRAGQFMYSRLFAFEGAYAAVPKHFDGYFVSGEFPTFDVDLDRVLAAFLAACFKSEQTWTTLAGSSKGLGVRRQRIHAESLLAHKVWLPPLDRQRQVVSLLERLEQAAILREQSRVHVAALEASALNRSFAPLA